LAIDPTEIAVDKRFDSFESLRDYVIKLSADADFLCLAFATIPDNDKFVSVSEEIIDFLGLKLRQRFMRARNMVVDKEEQVNLMQMEL